MADAKLQIVIDALNKAGDDLQKLKKDIDGVDKANQNVTKSSKNFGETWAGVMTGINSGIMIAQQLAAAMKKVYETAREGAELELTATRFDNLARSAGTAADVLMTDLREATQGMFSDAELMASATDFMALGLAKSHDEVVRLSTVAGALNMNMNQLVLTLTNKTTMRFDALGVSVDGFDEKVKELEASGLSVQDAFTEAFLQQAEEQIDKVGSAADSAAGDFMALEAAVKNGTDNMKRQIAEVLAPAIGNLADKMTQARDAQDALRQAQELGMITQEDFNRLASHEGMQRYGDEIAEVVGDVDAFTQALRDNTEANNFARDPYYETATAVDEIESSVIDATTAMQKYNESLLFKIASEGLSSEAALSLAESMGLVDENTMFAVTQTDQLRQRYDDGIISAEQYEDAIANLADELDRIRSKSVVIDVTIATREIQALKSGNVGDLGDTEEDRPTGGPVYAGNPYLWQEHGYRGEMFVPSQNGYVLSRADAKRILQESGKGGGGTVNNFTLNMPTSNNPSDVAMAFDMLRAYGS